MSDPVIDPVRRSALDDQLEVLVVLERRLAAAAALAPRLPEDAWRGPAADACRERDAELAGRLRDAARTAHDLVLRVHALLAAS